MKRLIFGIVVLVILNLVLADQSLSFVSLKRSDGVVSFIERVFKFKNNEKENQRNIDVNKENALASNYHCSHSCKACIFVVKMYERFIDRSKRAVTVQKVFLETCDILKPNARRQCRKFYHGIGLKVIKMILRGVNPRKVCRTLHLCKHEINPSDLQDVFEDMHRVVADGAKKSSRCKDCVRYTNYLEMVLDSKKSLNFIIRKLTKICSIYSSKYRKGCNNYFRDPAVRQYYRSVLAHKCPYKICRNVRMCAQRDRNHLLNDVRETVSTCQVCKQLVFVYGHLNRDKLTWDKSVFKSMCNYLPTKSIDRCHDFIDEYENALSDHFSGGRDRLCTKIKVCSVPEESASPKEKSESMVCEIVSSAVYELVGNTKTEGRVNDVLSDICGKLAKFLQEDCQIFLSGNSHKLVASIVEGLSQEHVCSKLSNHKTDKFAIEQMTNANNCELCRLIKKSLEELITKNTVKSEIEKVVKIVCVKVPEVVRTGCDEFVGKFLDELVEYLVFHNDSAKICEYMGFCDSKGNRVISAKDTNYFLPKLEINRTIDDGGLKFSA